MTMPASKLFSRLLRATIRKPVGHMPVCSLLMCCLFHLSAQTPPPQDPDKPIDPVKTAVTVTGKISTETPANITLLDQNKLAQSPGTNLDDRLRDIPGFSLFRRSSSLVANPTTQGISLRGIGSSGASRTLVLWDGIPANDPFGGWVYWTQFVPDEVSSAEVSRGAATSVFGEKAMSGAIGLFSRTPDSLHLFLQYERGNLDTNDISGAFSQTWGTWAFSGAASEPSRPMATTLCRSASADWPIPVPTSAS